MQIVMRIGGSVVASPVNPELISKYAQILRKLKEQNHRVVVVVGGGTLAREFIEIAKKLGLGQKAQDRIAISVSRLYAQLLLEKIADIGCETVPVNIQDVAECFRKKGTVVMGGLKPGMTTDTVAALVATRVKADMLVKATDQEGVYDKDPRKYADAVKLGHLSLEDLSRACSEDKHKAGIHQIIDPEAIKILKRCRVKVIVVNGFNPRNVLTAIKGESVGTLID